MTTIRAQAIDAAIELIGTEGLRALSHARVAERAGLPKGSTSNYFRTLLHRIARHDDTDPRPTFDLVVRGALR